MPPPADPPTGARITGVDDKTYSSTGEAFSTILLPHAESTAAKKLQADDVSLGAPLADHCLLIQRSFYPCFCHSPLI
jgi:hypothetical protein